MLKFRVTNSTKARRAAEAQRKALEEKVRWRGGEKGWDKDLGMLSHPEANGCAGGLRAEARHNYLRTGLVVSGVEDQPKLSETSVGGSYLHVVHKPR